PRDLEIRQAPEELAEHDRDLAAREGRAEAVVRSRAAEADVLVRAALEVEAVRIVEGRLVAVRRDVPEHELVARADRLPCQLGVARRRAPEVDHRYRPAHDLLHRGRRQRFEVLLPERALRRALAE